MRAVKVKFTYDKISAASDCVGLLAGKRAGKHTGIYIRYRKEIGRMRRNENLIVDGNAVYEIDPECMRKLEEKKKNEERRRLDRNQKNKNRR